MMVNESVTIISDQMKRALWEVGELFAYPKSCEYNRFTLIIAQIRHLHTHMGMIMGFIIADTNLWPRVLGLEGIIPDGNYDKYF